jgi:superfamily II DNA or RNA helicase
MTPDPAGTPPPGSFGRDLSARAGNFARMQRPARPQLDEAALAGAVGPTTYRRGEERMRQGGIVRLRWDESRGSLHGTVRGSAGELYTTTVYFAPADGAPLRFEQGICTCPVAVDCKHAVALALQAARDLAAAAAPPGPAGPQARGWEQSLEALLEPGPGSAGAAGSTPLAIELTLSGGSAHSRAHGTAAGGPLVSLSARLVRPGRSGWVGGSLGWTKLGPHLHSEHPAAQVRVLQELYAAYGAGRPSRPYNSYSYADDRAIDLTAFQSRQLWPLLDEGEAAGLQLVYGHRLGPVARYRAAEVCLDATGDPAGALVLAPAVRIDGEDAVAAPVMFIGSQAHGVVYLPPGAARSGDPDSWRFGLARLTRTVAPQLQQLALSGRRLDIPAAEQSRFRDEFYPRLRHAATVISSDGSFAPPEISGPALVLRADYGEAHDVEVAWEWAYQVGDSDLRTSLESAEPAGGYRDAEAEGALLRQLDLPLDRFGLRRGGPAAAAGHRGADPGPAVPAGGRLAGIDTMRFTTELLPLLAGQPGVRVEVRGEPADYREASDSLRIEVSTDEVAGDADWFGLGLVISVDGREIPFRDVFVALHQGESHLILPDGAYFALDKPELGRLAALIGEAQALQDRPGGPLRISRFQAGLWEELAELGVVGHQASAWQRQVEGLLTLRTVEGLAPPAALGPLLRPYQLDGFQWLAFLFEHRLGGILADDMGLGKTLQTLALISHARRRDPGGAPFLIVAPTSVVPNWATESARFTPELRLATISDTQGRRGHGLSELIAGADVVVTSYTLLRIDFEDYGALDWSGLILDEAQHTKNHQSKIYQCARQLPAPVKIAITGTPMENNLMELWSLLSITAPGLFPHPQRFRDYFARPIENGGQGELLGRLRRRIRPLVLRRTKEQVAADLPAKQQQVVEVELSPRHRKVYEAHLQRERLKVLGLIDDLNSHRLAVLRSLTLLRQLSLHAGLVDTAHEGLPSSKIEALLEQLGDVTGAGHRALVFSQFTGFLRKVRDQLDAAGLPYCYLDGQTRNRAQVLQRFRDDPVPVFLISLKAGGTGLNLTEADYCFLLDPWWNPATEAQAIDRIHRIGQTRNVMVYRLIAKDTIEEKVVALQARKAALFSSVIDADEMFSTRITADDIRGLFA